MDVMLCVLAQALIAALRARLPGCGAVTPDTIQRRFLETPGRITTTSDAITIRLARRAYGEHGSRSEASLALPVSGQDVTPQRTTR